VDHSLPVTPPQRLPLLDFPVAEFEVLYDFFGDGILLVEKNLSS
jgi:hypothetical protein